MDNINLLSQFPKHRRIQHAVFAFYDFHPLFFEAEILPYLTACSSVLVLVDQQNYKHCTDGQQMPKHLGTRYLVEPIEVVRGYAFHPKLALLIGDSWVRLLIGSGNLTTSGFKKNAELFTVIKFGDEEDDTSNSIVLDDVHRFFHRLLLDGYVQGTVKERLENIFETWPVQVDSAGYSEPTIRLLHTFEGPLIRQIAAQIGSLVVRRLHVISPYFDQDAKFVTLVKELRNHPGYEELHIYLQRDTNTFPKNLAINHPEISEELTFWEVDFNEEHGVRTLHAKMLLFETDEGSFCLVGSPNFTYAALKGYPPHGNIETALFFYEPEPSRFAKHVLQNDYVRLTPVNLHEVVPDIVNDDEPQEKDATSFTIRIIDAVLGGNSILVEYEGVDEKRYGRHLAHLWDTTGKQWTLSVRISQPGLIEVKIPVEEHTTSANNYLLQLDFQDSEDGVLNARSLKRWIVNPTGANQPHRGMDRVRFSHCVSIGGIEGIYEAIRIARQVETPDWLLRLLRGWDLSKIIGIMEPVPITRRRERALGKRGRGIIEEPNYSNLAKNLHFASETQEIEYIIFKQNREYTDKAKRFMACRSDPISVKQGSEYFTTASIILLVMTVELYRKVLREREKPKHEKAMGYPHYKYLHYAKKLNRVLSALITNFEEFISHADSFLRSMGEQTQTGIWFLFHYCALFQYLSEACTQKSVMRLKENRILLDKWKAVEAKVATYKNALKLQLKDNSLEYSAKLWLSELNQLLEDMQVEPLEINNFLFM